MGRPPLNGFFAMSNAQRQAHYRRNRKEKETKVVVERDAFRSELIRSNHELQCLQCQTTDEKLQGLLRQIDALKTENAELKKTNKTLAEEYRELHIDKCHLERQLRDVTKVNKTIPVGITPFNPMPTVKRTEDQVIDDILKLKSL
jgi:uncharacterized coiled-coil DUF342 family protein